MRNTTVTRITRTGVWYGAEVFVVMCGGGVVMVHMHIELQGSTKNWLA